MAIDERDTHTGYMTTGHEWNGIKELNTPVPRVVYFFLIVTALFAFSYWILMPAWPLGLTYTKGLLGIDQRTTVMESLQQAALQREPWTRRIGTESYQAVQADPNLMTNVRQTGRTLFGDNCAACHGFNAKAAEAFRTSQRRPGCGAVIRKPSRKPFASVLIQLIQKPEWGRCSPSGATGCCNLPT